MKKKLMSVDDLYNFCIKNKFYHFNCADADYEICVQVPASGVFSEQESDKHKDGLRLFTAKAYHDNVNLNKSEIDPDVFKENTKSAPFRPILAHIVKNEETGELDFGSHDYVIEKDEQGKEDKIVYQEQPVGVINTDFSFEYDDEQEVNRAILNGYLYEEYCQDAIDILERRSGTDCSIELSIREFSFNAKSGTLMLDDYYISGLTMLGSAIDPGMKGSNLSLKDFSAENNSVVFNADIQETLIDTLNRIDTALSLFNIDGNQKGGNDMFKKLLEKHGKTEKDINFEINGLTDEELEAKFAEVFDENPASDKTSDEEGEPEDEEQGEEDSESEDFKKKKGKKRCSIDLDGKVFEFDLSLNEKIYALQDLVNITYGDIDETYYGIQAYDTYVIMIDYWYNKSYKQSYSEKDGVFTLVGDRVEVFSNWLTADEETALAEMRANYAIIKEKLDTYEKAENDAKKDEIFADKAYQEYLGTEDFKTLINDKDKYSVDELKEKADLTFAKCVKQTGVFGLKPEELKETNKRTFVSNKNKVKNSPYGSIFANKN